MSPCLPHFPLRPNRLASVKWKSSPSPSNNPLLWCSSTTNEHDKLRILQCVESPIQCLERAVVAHVKAKPEMTWRKTVPGIGNILALTILLETGTIARFAHVGDFVSSCRCVKSQRLSNGKVTGHGNAKNGHPSLGWAFVEAANVAIRFDSGIKRFSQRRQTTRHQMGARKTVANTLARACYDIMRDQVPCGRSKAFG